MSRPTATGLPLCLALLLSLAAMPAWAQNIYKCTHGGQVEYTDKPCAGQGELVHRASDADIIDRYLRLGQDDAARGYAESHLLQGLYEQRLAVHQQAVAAKARAQAEEAAAAQQRLAEAQQQELADAQASRDRLQRENDALRQQNADYQDQLTPAQGIYASPYPYWGAPPRWPRHGDRDNHRPSPPPPNFHPCETLAGGRLRC